MNPASLFPPPPTTIARNALGGGGGGGGGTSPRAHPDTESTTMLATDGGNVQRLTSISQRMRNVQAVMTSTDRRASNASSSRRSSIARLTDQNHLTPTHSGESALEPGSPGSPGLFRSRFSFMPPHRRRSSHHTFNPLDRSVLGGTGLSPLSPSDTPTEPPTRAYSIRKGPFGSRTTRAPASIGAVHPLASSVPQTAPPTQALARHNSISNAGVVPNLDSHELQLLPNPSNAFYPGTRRHVSLSPEELCLLHESGPDSDPRQRRSSMSCAATASGKARTAGARDPVPVAPSEAGVTYDFVRPEDLKRVFALESECREPDDVTPLDRLSYRLQRAPFLFLGAYVSAAPTRRPLLQRESFPGEEVGSPRSSGPKSPFLGPAQSPKKVLVGYICATASPAFTVQATKVHDDGPDARTVCIHSVVVAKGHRHHGFGTGLVRTLLGWIREAELGSPSSVASTTERGTTQAAGTSLGDSVVIRKRGYEEASVLTHPSTIPFFRSCGFRLLGMSYVQTGTEEEWYEMRQDIVPASAMAPWDPAWADEDARVLEPQYLSYLLANEARRWDRHVYHQLSISTATESAEPEAYLSPTSEVFATSPASSQPDSRKGTLAPDARLPGEGSPFPHAYLKHESRTGSRSNSDSYTPPTVPLTHKPSTQTWAAVYGNALASKTFAEDVNQALEARLVDRTLQTNLPEICCPRSDCRTLLLAPDRALYEQRETGPLSAPEASHVGPTPFPRAPSAPIELQSGRHAPSLTAQTFWVSPTKLALAGVGFSDEVGWKCGLAEGATTEVKLPIQYLKCARCGCGPVGYTYLPDPSDKDPSQEFLIAADRVRYRLLEDNGGT